MDWLWGTGWAWFTVFLAAMLLNGRAAFKLIELAPGVTADDVKAKTTAKFLA